MKFKENIKEQSGITLIALIITIIVLVILAAVSISAVYKSKIVDYTVNGAKEYASEALNENKIIEGTENLIESTVEKIHEIIGENGEDIIGERPKEKANAPDISGFDKSKTYYVTWDLTNSPYTINESTEISGTEPSDWYDYTAGKNKWANVKTTGGDNDCYWVWIPRYAYKVPTKGSTAETIEVKFLRGTSNVPIGETKEITNTTPTPGSWVVHPAFTWARTKADGTTEQYPISGIWVAKFEASCSDNSLNTKLDGSGGGDTAGLKVRVKPNVTSWRAITVNNIFKVCQNLTTTGNSLEKTSGIDSHMMKNTEWGAVAYLSRSIYGKNDQVWNNPWVYNIYYSPVTGRADKSNDANALLKGNDVANYETVTDAYNIGNGPEASTTGNVYGVYDMAGGAWDCVAGILSSKKSNSPYYDFSSIDNRYYDSYDGYNNTRYGDAVYETSSTIYDSSINSNESTSWDNDYSRFVNSSGPVFARGASGVPGQNGTNVGIFAFTWFSGGASNILSFRPCLVGQ